MTRSERKGLIALYVLFGAWLRGYPVSGPEGGEFMKECPHRTTMLSRFVKFLLLLTVPCSAQTITLSTNQNNSTPSPSVPFHVARGTYLPVTAVVAGVNNKGVNWTSSAGTLTNATCTANGPCTVSLYSATAQGPITLTATSAANPGVSAISYVTFDASPTPLSSSDTPGFLLTNANITALRARANSSNVLFTAQLNRANSLYNFVTTSEGWTFTCPTGGSTSIVPQFYDAGPLFYFALMAELGDTSRDWKCITKAMTLYELPLLVNGSLFFTGNNWSDDSSYIILGIAWSIQSGALTTTSDLNTVRAGLAFMGRSTNGYFNGPVIPTTGLNTSTQFTQSFNPFAIGNQRAMGNNYALSKMLFNAGVALMFHDDTTNDPPLTGVDNTCGATRYQICSDYTAGSLHAYFQLLTGSYLLKAFAHMEPPEVTYPALNSFFPSGGFTAPVNCAWAFPYPGGTNYDCFGDGVGGESAEGSWYAYSFYRLRLALNIIHNAGYDDPLIYGPQVALGNMDFWDMKHWSDRSFITGSYTQGTITGPNFGYLITGDANSINRVPTDFLTETETLTTDSWTGRTDRTNADQWFTMATSSGGTSGSLYGCTSSCGYDNQLNTDYAAQTALDLFINTSANDPATLAPTDPAPNYPLDLWNNSYNRHQETRSGYANTDVIFSVYGSNTLINHEGQFQGRFDVYFNGGMITKGTTVFTNYIQSLYSMSRQNAVQIYDSVGAASTDSQLLSCLADATGPYGGQLYQGYQLGIGAAPAHSEMPAYTAYGIDATSSQNGCYFGSGFQFTDTTQAYRDILYLRGTNQVLWYDRDTTGHTASTKVLFLNTSGNGTVSSNTVAWTAISGGNKAKYTSLLPAGAAVTANKLVQTVIISGPHSSLQNGTTMQAACTATYMDGTTVNVTGSAGWMSDTPSVATVSSSGLVTAVTTGTTNVYCGIGPTGNLPTRFSASIVPSYYSPGAVTVVSGASSGTLTGSAGPDQTNDWETIGNVQVTPSGTPLSVNFLSALAWTNSGGTPATATLVQSSAGQGFDCGLYGTVMGCFMQTRTSFTGTTYAASGATTQYLSDLTPNTSYTISGAGAPTSGTTDNAGVLTFSATGTGNIVIAPNGGVAAPSQLQGVVCSGCSIR